MFRNKTSIFKWHLCPYFNWTHVSNGTLFFLGDQNYSQRFIRCIKIHQMPWLFVRISSSCRCRHCCAAFLFFFYFIFALRNFMELLFWHRGANGYGLEVIKTDQHFQRWKCTKAKWRCFFYWRLLKQWMRMVWFIFHLRRNLKFWNGRATWDKWAYETVVCYVRSRRNSTRNTPEKETQCK